MLTIKLRYNSSEEDKEVIDTVVYEYTSLFYKLYNNFELSQDKNFIKQNLSDYLDKFIYRSICIDVKSKLEKTKITYDKNVKLISQIEEQIVDADISNKKKYKLKNKLASLTRNLNKDICFGGKNLLREITKLSQNNNNPDLLEKKKSEFKEKRKIGLYVVGEANQQGNRKLHFDLKNKKLNVKLNKKNHINLTFSSFGKQFKNLEKLQDLIEQKLISVTFRLDNKYIYLSYDEAILNNHHFDIISCKKKQLLIDDKDEKKKIFIEFKKEQNERKLKDKIENRYLAFDLNPNYIGFSILEKVNNDENKILFTQCIDLTKLNTKKNVASTDKKQLKQNNKRIHEINHVWKYIFGVAKHWRVYNIVKEDLNFKGKNKDLGNKVSNRLTKNVWHRTLTEKLITKYCNEYGFNLIEVNPAFSSFIGNFTNNNFDPIASSLEINRRGVGKYTKGFSIYPSIEKITQGKMNYLLEENILIDENTSWYNLYTRTKRFRYRNLISDDRVLLGKYLYSKNSKVKFYY